MQVATRPEMPLQPANRMNNMVAPLSGQTTGLQKAFVTNGIREVLKCLGLTFS